MNYAEDRLDRRARYHDGNSSRANNDGIYGTPSPSPLELDLIHAHELLRNGNGGVFNFDTSCDDGDTINITDSGNEHENENHVKKAKGHELAGRTLRDAGQVRRATFHYGMAWYHTCYILKEQKERETDDKEEHENGNLDMTILEKAVGDYAQMVEFAGFPEVGALALLYHANGGDLSDYDADDIHMERNNLEEGKDVLIAETTTGSKLTVGNRTSPCHIPPSMIRSSEYKKILEAIRSMEQSLQFRHENTEKIETAASILERVTKTTQKKNPIPVTAATSSVKSPSYVPSLLQFWDVNNHHPTPTKHRRHLSPLLQILLVKLLYSAPVNVCIHNVFVHLACHAVRHLSLSLPVSSKEGRRMANTHKSHWAYYILIYKMILGERVKKSRRNTVVPYHVPIWDIENLLDQRKGIATVLNNVECAANGTEENSMQMNYLEGVLNILSKDCRLDDVHLDDHCTKDPRQFKWIVDGDYYVSNSPRAWTQNPLPQRKIIFALGDSHVLSIGWQTLCIPLHATTTTDTDTATATATSTKTEIVHRTIVPCPITGLKAWHTRESTLFFTKTNLECCLQRLPSTCKTILLSAGEIDCREGIGGTLLEGYANDCQEAVERTVREYTTAISDVAERYDIQVLLMPVAPHAYRSEKNGRALGRGLRRERMVIWNDLLRSILCEGGPLLKVPDDNKGKDSTCTRKPITIRTCIGEDEMKVKIKKKKRLFLLDYEKHLRSENKASPVGFVLNNAFNADFTHMNSAFLPLLEDALVNCGCDLDLI